MRRIAFFLPNLSGGGAERVVVNLLKGISDRGILLDLILASAEGPYLHEVPKQVRVINLEVGRVIKAILPLARYIRENEPLVLISHLSHANVAAVLANQIAEARTKLVLVEHNTWSASKVKLLRARFIPLLSRLLYPKADYIVAVSEAASRDLEKNLSYETGKVKTIYNPVVSYEIFDKANAVLVHPWFQDSSPPVFLAVGRLTEQKDFFTLIKSFSRLREKMRAHLLILGEGELRDELENFAKTLGIAEDILLEGFVENPYAYMSKAAAVVLSSRWEGLPTVLIEAMACGCPVIATDCPSGPREILKSGRYGPLVPVGDDKAMSEAMLNVLQKPIAKDLLIQRSMHIASIEKATSEYLELIGYK